MLESKQPMNDRHRWIDSRGVSGSVLLCSRSVLQAPRPFVHEQTASAATQRYAGSRPFDIPSQRIVGESFSLSGASFPAIDGGKDLFHPPFLIELIEACQTEGLKEQRHGPPDPLPPGPQARGSVYCQRM